MPSLTLAAVLASTSPTTTKSSSSGGGSEIFLVVLIGLVAIYFLVLRPRTKRMRQQQQSKAGLEVGDQVISAGGILGTITAIAGDEIVVEVAPGTHMTFWRRAISLRTAVAGAPQGDAFADGPPDDGTYDADSYDEESYDDESYDDEAGEAGPDGGDDEADHRDIAGGQGEGH